MGLCISCSAIHIKLALEVRRPLFIFFFFFFFLSYYFFYAAYFIIINPGAKHYVWLLRASPVISAITAPHCGVRAEPLEDAGVPWRCLDKGDKRQGEKGKNPKARIGGSVLPACLLLPISWVSAGLFSCAARHRYVLHGAWHCCFIFTHYRSSELE